MHIITILLLLLFASVQQNAHYTLDLTDRSSIVNKTDHFWGQLPANAYAEGKEFIQTSPFELKLFLEKDTYNINEEYNYDLYLKNITDRIIDIPCEYDPSKIIGGYSVPPPGYAAINLGIEITRVEGDKSMVDHLGLYGSDDKEGSIIRLRPGEDVRIKAKGRWDKERVEKYFMEDSESAFVYTNAVFIYTYGLQDPAFKKESISESIKVTLKRLNGEINTDM